MELIEVVWIVRAHPAAPVSLSPADVNEGSASHPGIVPFDFRCACATGYTLDR